ncbi:expressed unknown protein [Seminavis robusta]|uniref:Uncharacterized protein n=1 Tax=Seminavis robusta TaxID=568900 RepID=A0A9N8HJB3_9STRA|nr:expressed unknown protein [Seminavis robusta]|eukprot:Sro650_g181320.1 n/a (120) ;mRNA; f:4974-5333
MKVDTKQSNSLLAASAGKMPKKPFSAGQSARKHHSNIIMPIATKTLSAEAKVDVTKNTLFPSTGNNNNENHNGTTTAANPFARNSYEEVEIVIGERASRPTFYYFDATMSYTFGAFHSE